MYNSDYCTANKQHFVVYLALSRCFGWLVHVVDASVFSYALAFSKWYLTCRISVCWV